ncbi:MAG: hypothetical protein ABSB01_04035, partial [Streptosporangiaceae bacterium]
VADVFDVLGVLGVGDRLGQGDVLQARPGRLAAPIGLDRGGRMAGGQSVAAVPQVRCRARFRVI